MKQNAKRVRSRQLNTPSILIVMILLVFACNQQTSQKGQAVKDDVFTIVEDLPQYPSGMDAFYQYLMNEISYPAEARMAGVEGRVEVQFVVERDGSIADLSILNGIGSGCDEEALGAVKYAASFRPGTQRGKPVRVRMVLPIVFELSEDKKNADNSPQGIIVVEQVKLIKEPLKVEADYASGEWSGKVYDTGGDGLPGVNIIVGGTSNGTVSDLNGSFRLKAEPSQDVFFSFVGFETVKLGGN